jgi:hypothetical protein
MGGLFGGAPAAPAPLPDPVLPQKSDADIQASRTNERKRRLAASGRASTILTSGTGVTDDSTSTKKTLLG